MHNKIMLNVDKVEGGQEISATFHNNYKYTFDRLETSLISEIRADDKGNFYVYSDYKEDVIVFTQSGYVAVFTYSHKYTEMDVIKNNAIIVSSVFSGKIPDEIKLNVDNVVIKNPYTSFDYQSLMNKSWETNAILLQ